jgi:signal peptidase I
MSDPISAEQPPQMPAVEQQPTRGLLRDVLETILPALLIVVVVNAFLAQATRVEGQSMEPNLHDSQRLVIEKVSYHLHPPQRGDIVVIKSPNWIPVSLGRRIVGWVCAFFNWDSPLKLPDPLIKRVIGLPGETIEVRNGYVYINGQVLQETYLNQMTLGNYPPHVISPNHVFVLGDNRGASNDSRSFGEVALQDIIGRAWFRYWPPDQVGALH